MRLLAFVNGISLFLLFACSTAHTLKDRRVDYRHYINSQLQEAKTHEVGKLLVAAKALPLTAEVVKCQEDLSPGLAQIIVQDQRSVILALDYPENPAFSLSQININLNGRKALKSEEIWLEDVIRTHYFFAYPHYRVFRLDFASAPETQEDLNIGVPSAKLVMKLNFAPPGGN